MEHAAVMRGARLVMPGWRNKLLAQAVRFSPRSVVLAIATSMQE